MSAERLPSARTRKKFGECNTTAGEKAARSLSPELLTVLQNGATRSPALGAISPPPGTVSPPLLPPPVAERRSPLIDSKTQDAISDQFHELRCPVCLDPFNNPVTLPCNHNVCQRHVLDLAAAQTAQKRESSGPAGELHLQCPTCRHACTFANAEAIHINIEMKAIIDTMLRLINTRGIVPAPSAQPNVPDVKAQQTPTAQPHQERAKSAATLEKQLKLQREALQRQRDAKRQDAVRAFKEQRRKELEERNRAEAAPTMALDEVLSGPLDACDRDSLLEEEEWKRQEAEFLALKRQREAAREEERRRREEQVHAAVRDWMGKAETWKDEAPSMGEMAEHLSRLDAYVRKANRPSSTPKVNVPLPEPSLPLSARDAPVSREEKVRIAEARLDEVMAARLPPVPTPTPVKEPEMVDVEVERALVEVERQVTRERDEELTRAEMAEIAERRARQMIAHYRGTKPPPKPTYVPKLQRMKPF